MIDKHRFVELREKCGLSQTEFAKISGLSVRQISRYETGVCGVPPVAYALLKLISFSPKKVKQRHGVTELARAS